VREIRAWRIGIGGKRLKLRLWTTLMDPERYPADTLAQHYVQRWEGERCYPKFNLDARGPAHIFETVVQEIAAMVLASAVVARLRVETVLRQAVSSWPGRTHLACQAGQVKIQVVRIRR
jgi:hypothetical protein